MLRIYIHKKYLVAFRIVMIIAALPFADNVYDAVTTGTTNLRTDYVTRGEHWGFYANVAKNLAFTFFFIWLATGGTRKVDFNKDDDAD